MIEYIKFHNARQWEFFHYRYSQYEGADNRPLIRKEILWNMELFY